MTGNAILHFLKVLAGIDKPSTQTSAAERRLLEKYSANAKTAVEIGVFEGVNTALIAAQLRNDGILYGIDPFFKGRLGICYSKLVTKRTLKVAGLTNKVKLIEKLSFDAVNDVPDDIDFIFIDGDHSLEGIRRDWQDWSAKLKKGGIIALHDSIRTETNKNISLGSIDYFENHIKYDDRFVIKDKVDSVHILEKVV